ncbi:hypothetical protein Pmani_039147 [Petrolisthes manimaculis]|uniref:Uncharacterized protein n=1 Tax=Petrolisthes manimaculis TaxID=1843537 RepID=A0AAE1NEA9_9EUCA|nr:hypothetical protein Pmani_039147 [Petrolisthes manimaculis]
MRRQGGGGERIRGVGGGERGIGGGGEIVEGGGGVIGGKGERVGGGGERGRKLHHFFTSPIPSLLHFLPSLRSTLDPLPSSPLHLSSSIFTPPPSSILTDPFPTPSPASLTSPYLLHHLLQP